MTHKVEAVNVNEWLAGLSESSELECKLAAGRDGKGAVPQSLWETYSAIANTLGGVILLGSNEKSRGRFIVEGVQDTEKVIMDLFNTLNNPSKVSANLICDSDVEVLDIDGQSVIKITVPQATRKQKPVYLGGNPLGKRT